MEFLCSFRRYSPESTRRDRQEGNETGVDTNRFSIDRSIRPRVFRRVLNHRRRDISPHIFFFFSPVSSYFLRRRVTPRSNFVISIATRFETPRIRQRAKCYFRIARELSSIERNEFPEVSQRRISPSQVSRISRISRRVSRCRSNRIKRDKTWRRYATEQSPGIKFKGERVARTIAN